MKEASCWNINNCLCLHIVFTYPCLTIFSNDSFHCYFPNIVLKFKLSLMYPKSSNLT